MFVLSDEFVAALSKVVEKPPPPKEPAPQEPEKK
jgi:hypothetical protein